MLIIYRKKIGPSYLCISYERLQNTKNIQKKVIIFKIKNLGLKVLDNDFFFFDCNDINFENMLFASIQITIPRNKIERMKIY